MQQTESSKDAGPLHSHSHSPGPGQTARALQVLSEAELNRYFLYKKFYITLCKVKNQINWQELHQRDKLQA